MARNFPVVGMGASAGGLEAFTKVLTHLPIDTGMAFVLLQHLDPSHESMSADILSRTTKMPVQEVKDGTQVQPNCVYVIPSGFSMEILGGVLHLSPRPIRTQQLVIDIFFNSLALDQKNLAIGIVLSGTGSDGTLGLMAIKAEGGITFAQTPKTAKFDGMPQSAIASGSIDLILPAEKIAQELARIAPHPYVRTIDSTALQPAVEDDRPLKPQDSLNQIFLLLRKHCHVDFSSYKSNSVKRRIERRMVLLKLDSLKAYVAILSQKPSELKSLYADILIHVTGFFRDPEAFEALKETAFPRLMENRAPGVPIRIWVPGCSTGQEVYSLAIALIEFLGEKASHSPIQIFASDISELAIQKARMAEYSENLTENVSRERLSRFFVKQDSNGYRIVKSIRDLCVFSRHDLTTDPPFARIDLISCRNLLIYFNPSLQKHVLPIFHYSLAPGGLLFLGKSETIGGATSLFSIIDKSNKIYSRENSPIALNRHFPSSTYVHGKPEVDPEPTAFRKVELDVLKMTEQTFQAEYPGVLVNQNFEILQVRGRTAPFVELVPGAPSFQLMKMAHPDLLRDLRTTLREAGKSKRPVRSLDLSLGDGRKLTRFNLNVVPIKHPHNSKEQFFLILFENISASKLKEKRKPANSSRKSLKGKSKKDPYVLKLHEELTEHQEYQRFLAEKYETTQEDLTAANEELQSANEEMQSTNEELETAKEELQSVNEELTTVNDELQTRGIEQVQTNNDLINLLGSVEIPIVMLAEDQRIRRFTPLAGKALNLIATDIGRPLSDLKLNFISPSGEIDLEKMVSTTIETNSSQEVEVQDRKGHWFRLQVRPYKTLDNRIDGTVLALVDINDLKQSLDEVKAARSESIRANRAKDLFLATLSHELRTPLTAILSWAQLLRSGKLDAEKSKRALEIIEDNGKTQAQLINDLLDISRIISGKIALETIEVDPASVIAAAVDAVRPTAEARSIQIETFFAPKVGTVLADPVRLQQVFWNLLTNAVKFSTPGSKVSVRVDRINDAGKGKAIIRVEDSGKGIAAEFLPQIFDRFSQEDSSSVRVHGGLGLGLAIVRDLVELHGGSIRAESLGDKRGSCFIVMLPIRSDQTLSDSKNMNQAPLQNKETTNITDVNLNGVRVLIVDDESNAREAFCELLSSLGAEVKSADSANEGINIFEKFKPHVIVSDIAMPGEDGYSLIKKVRALEQAAGGKTPALAMTAYAGAEDIQQALSAGFHMHLSKPVDGQDLAKAIAKLFGESKNLVH